MSLLGKKWPTPVAKPMAPFFVAGLIMMYAINSAANALPPPPKKEESH